MNLREQLREILPKCLPESPAESIKGTQLIKLVKHQLKQKYSDATLRYHFSVMSCDPASPIAKVNQGQGYYLRGNSNHQDKDEEQLQAAFVAMHDPSRTQSGGFLAEREADVWQIFQAIYERCEEKENRFIFPFRHDNLKDIPRHRFWTLPDAAVVEWRAAVLDESGVRLKPDLLAVVDRPFVVTSVKLVIELNPENFREVFFQSLSNSAWAHASELVIAGAINDDTLVNELCKLGYRHGVDVTSFGMKLSKLGALQSPAQIFGMRPHEIESVQEWIRPQRIASPRVIRDPDWDRLNDLREKRPSADELFQWIHRCRVDCKAYSLGAFRRL